MKQGQLVVIGALAAGMFTIGWLTSQATEAQPHMHKAVDLLTQARAELTAARPNKGGHRTEAIRLINEAIRETQDGIADGNLKFRLTP